MSSDDNTQTCVQYAIIAFCLTGLLMEIIFLIACGTIWGWSQFIIVFLVSSAAAVGGFFAGKLLS
ncbi:MAG: hypothetical protein JXB10_03830 [Pirellulales bacterium]|nr:hypothetical protein [Pirellulales bacterium]